MPETPSRRTLLGTIAGAALLAGCMGESDDGDAENPNGNESTEAASNDTEDADDADEELSEEDIVVLFEEILTEEGLETTTVERSDDVLEVEYLATGDTDEAAATEIEIVADVYARAIDAGLTTDQLDAAVEDPESDVTLDTFSIETEWTEAFLDEEIDWDEYIEQIIETFEATEEAQEAEELTEDEIVDLFLTTLAEEGIETASVEQTSDELAVTYFATGADEERDLELIADVYADAVAEGLTFDLVELTRQDPEEGTDLETFTIETDWTESYLDEEIDFDEYVSRIDDTVESIEDDDSDQEDEAEAEEDDEDEPEDEAEGDDEDEADDEDDSDQEDEDDDDSNDSE